MGVGWVVAILMACSATPVVTCPPLRIYTSVFSARLADEIVAAPADVVWPVVVEDYKALRSMIKAACP
jgi:hypothetical protein